MTDLTIYPRRLSGAGPAIASKSQAHRLLICAAFADRPTELLCPETNRDIQATVRCLQALGAEIHFENGRYHVSPARSIPPQAELPCGESGSTLRFLLPVAGALGVEATFLAEGRLPQRPLSPLWEEMERMGCTLDRPTPRTIRCRGRLKSGLYTLDGGVSSQFLSGILFALALLPEGGALQITGTLQSAPYLAMTREALARFGISCPEDRIPPGSRLRSPGRAAVEGDWSSAAFFLTAGAIGSNVTVTGLNPRSAQGDRAIADLLPRMTRPITIDAADIPDLVPILAVAAGAGAGCVFENIRRLRLKESDRAATVCAMLRALGSQARAEENAITVLPGGFRGGTVDAAGDHRIAMAAAIAATVCREPVTILGAQCVEKSYPRFWEDYRLLGGVYEQRLR